MNQGGAEIDWVDEPESRTRMAWVRSVLSVGLVAALIVRALFMDEATVALMLLTLALAAILSMIMLRRYRQLRHDGTSILRLPLVITFVSLVLMLAGIGIYVVIHTP